MYYGLLLTWESPTMKKNQPSLGDVHVKAMRNLRPRNHGYREAILLMCLPEQGTRASDSRQERQFDLSSLRQRVLSCSVPEGKILFKTLHRCLPQGTWPTRQEGGQPDMQDLREGIYYPVLLAQENGAQGRTILFSGLLQ